MNNLRCYVTLEVTNDVMHVELRCRVRNVDLGAVETSAGSGYQVDDDVTFRLLRVLQLGVYLQWLAN